MRPEGACHQCRKESLGELSIDQIASEQLGCPFGPTVRLTVCAAGAQIINGLIFAHCTMCKLVVVRICNRTRCVLFAKSGAQIYSIDIVRLFIVTCHVACKLIGRATGAKFSSEAARR